MNWRFIEFERYEPFFKTGLNDALIDSVASGGDPVVFLAGWDRKTVNVGRSQSIEDRVDLEAAEEDDVTVVRRQGGGGTTYLTPDGEITWGMVAPDEYFGEDVNEIYRKKCGIVVDALKRLGIEAEHERVNDVVTEEGKISGSTLRSRDGATYFGGTLLYDVNPEEMFRYIRPDEDKTEDKRIEDYRERVSCVKNESRASFDEAREALRNALLDGDGKQWSRSELKKSELKDAKRLAHKYRGRDWLYRK